MTYGEKLALPVVLLLFVIQLHYYSFYIENFNDIRHFINPNAAEGQYIQVQRQNPYWEIYREFIKYPTAPIYLISQLAKDKDYTTTLLTGKETTISELQIVTRYWAYPRIPMKISLASLTKQALEEGSIVVSDVPLPPKLINTHGLQRIHTTKKPHVMANKKFEDPYFVYLKTK